MAGGKEGILCAQMREGKRKNTFDGKSNVEKTLILSRVFLFWIQRVRNQCFPTVYGELKWACPLCYAVSILCSLWQFLFSENWQ